MKQIPAVTAPHSNRSGALDRRWQLGRALAASNKPLSPRRYDAETIEIARFLRARKRRQATRPQAYRAASKWVGLAVAQKIFEGDARRRDEIEARILSGASVRDIARQCGVSVQSVRWYEAAFFDVRGRLACQDWVVFHVIGAAPEESSLDDTGRILKSLAYFAGTLVLELAIAVLGDCPLPPELSEDFTVGRSCEEARLRLSGALWIRALRAKTEDERRKLLHTYLAVAHIDNQKFVPAPDLSDVQKLLDAAHARAAERFANQRAKPRRAAPSPKSTGVSPPAIIEILSLFCPPLPNSPRNGRRR